MWTKLKQKYNRWMLNRLIGYTGCSLEPAPGVWGRISANEEDEVLATIYENDLFVALLKKYAERAVKEILSVARLDMDYGKKLGMFLAYNAILLKSRRAFQNREKKTVLAEKKGV